MSSAGLTSGKYRPMFGLGCVYAGVAVLPGGVRRGDPARAVDDDLVPEL